LDYGDFKELAHETLSGFLASVEDWSRKLGQGGWVVRVKSSEKGSVGYDEHVPYYLNMIWDERVAVLYLRDVAGHALCEAHAVTVALHIAFADFRRSVFVGVPESLQDSLGVQYVALVRSLADAFDR
jgi:hypothetical protein